jgi:hypothetical protein
VVLIVKEFRVKSVTSSMVGGGAAAAAMANISDVFMVVVPYGAEE